ncbi:MAG: hypothetical protein E6J91_52235 [Deltaproteobacteria bacterium]|nr:MAG: hypothetical protein E6J91_52235 [Deltaproteobacteria bacterium]
MEPRYEARLKALMSPWCSTELVFDLLGSDLDVRAEPRLIGLVRSWAARFRSDDSVVRQTTSGLEAHRHAFETFLVQNGLVSWKWAAIYYGLETNVLKTIVDHLEGRGDPVQVHSGVSEQLVRQREAASLFRFFPSLRNKVFASHDGMCIAFHSAVASDLNINFTPISCVTSAVLEPESPEVAVAFDAITMDPVGLRYQVWLDTKKPVNLAPDVCSLKFYARHETELRPYVMKGGEPENIDDKLRAA